MKLSPIWLILPFIFAAFSQVSYSEIQSSRLEAHASTGINYHGAGFITSSVNFEDYCLTPDEKTMDRIVKTPTDGGIREDIPKSFQEKYQKWKEEFLSTDFGRQQWEKYSNNKQFILTIVISDEKGKGAKTDTYLWDEQGNVAGATITLGNKIDKGFPDPVYYPVMNSLSSDVGAYSVTGNVLAATKFAHEFGHVNQLFETNKDLFRLQDTLMPVYNKFFLKNGHNTRDTYLTNLAQQMGGTPMKIWEDREYWSEVNAMNYLNEKINKENFYCTVVNKIKSNVGLYAKDYEERFDRITTLSCDK